MVGEIHFRKRYFLPCFIRGGGGLYRGWFVLESGGRKDIDRDLFLGERKWETFRNGTEMGEKGGGERVERKRGFSWLMVEIRLKKGFPNHRAFHWRLQPVFFN